MMKRSYLYLLLLLVALFSACSSQPQLPALSAGAIVLAFGDSLTYGTGAKEQEAYPAVLSRLTGLEVVNAGMPGEVTSQGVKRLPGVLDVVAPDMLILCHGGNDILRKLDLAAAARNLKKMIQMAKSRGITVLVIAVPKPGLMLSPPHYYEVVAQEEGVPIEMDILSDTLSARALKSDTIHPNADGYRKVAEGVLQLMKDTGAMK